MPRTSAFAFDLRFFQRMNGGAIEDRAVDAEMRAVAGAVPALLERIPVQMAAEMGAGRREGMQTTLVVAVGCHFLQAVANDLALAALDLVIGADFGRRDIFGE